MPTTSLVVARAFNWREIVRRAGEKHTGYFCDLFEPFQGVY